MFKLFPGAIIKLRYLVCVAIVFVNSLLIVVVWPFLCCFCKMIIWLWMWIITSQCVYLFRYFYKRIELNFLWPFHKTASKLITYTQQQPSFFLASRYVVDAASPFSFKGPLSLLNIYLQTLQPDVTHWAGEKQRHLKLGFNFCPCLVYSLPDHFKMWNECAFQILFFKPELHSLILNWKLAVIQAKKKT